MSILLLLAGGIVGVGFAGALLFVWALCRAAAQPTPTPGDAEEDDEEVRA